MSLSSWTDEPPQAGRETETWFPRKHRASLSCREMLQQILMVFLVTSRHNESSVPPTEFLLSSPVIILKSVESPFLLFSVCTLSSPSLPPSLPTYCEDLRVSFLSFLLLLFIILYHSLSFSVHLSLPSPCFVSRLITILFSAFNLLRWLQYIYT